MWTAAVPLLENAAYIHPHRGQTLLGFPALSESRASSSKRREQSLHLEKCKGSGCAWLLLHAGQGVPASSPHPEQPREAGPLCRSYSVTTVPVFSRFGFEIIHHFSKQCHSEESSLRILSNHSAERKCTAVTKRRGCPVL